MNAAKKTPDDYFGSAENWSAELRQLRAIIAPLGLTEEIKWGAPLYSLDGTHVVGLLGFKSYFGLWFHQGALLKDKAGVLINAQSGKTLALRQWRMMDADEIDAASVAAYVTEAAENARAGRTVPRAPKATLTIPDELKQAMKEDSGLANAFKTLTPGRQREYAAHISEAKQAATKARRITKITPLIKAGGGLHDKYK